MNRKQKLKSREDDRHRRIIKFRNMIRKFDDPILTQVCSPVVIEEGLGFLRTMRQACLATETGVGLAASQIGVAKQAVFIIPKRSEPENQWFMLNPEIVESSPEMEMGIEGCLSYPGYQMPVERPLWVKVRYIHVDSPPETILPKPTVGVFREFACRVVCHELDHLRGHCELKKAWEADLVKRATAKIQGQPDA